jgi:DNA-binding ferritin-like protein
MAKKESSATEMGTFLGKVYSYNIGLKLFHWHVTGPGSYAQHIALDQALSCLTKSLDSIVETTYAIVGDIFIVVPETCVPKNIVQYATEFYNYVDSGKELFEEDFSESLCDDIQEALQQLLYRLKRLQ